MKSTSILRISRSLGATLLLAAALPAAVRGQGTAFSYQGRLNSGGSPATGLYDLTFTLYDVTNNGAPLAGPLTNVATGVTNGLFTVTLDFGGVFTGTNLWLEIAVQTNGGSSFATLAPRQPVLPVPYALYAPNSGAAAYAAAAGTATAATAAATAASIGSVAAANVAQLNVSNTNLPATGALTIVGGFIVEAQVVDGGLGYPTAPVVSVADATGSNAVIQASVSANGVVTNLSVQSAGVGYSSNAVLVIAPPPSSAVQTFGTINNFTGVNTFSGALNANNLYLSATTTNTGVLYLGGNAFLYGGPGSLFMGYLAGNFSNSVSQLSSSWNVALGDHTLATVTTGYSDTAVGSQALQFDTTGYRNTALGRWALIYDTTGNENTGTGFQALQNNSSGSENTANGSFALHNNTTGGYNVANGIEALQNNTTGSYNTANGPSALSANTIGRENAANGGWSLYANTVGSYNVGNGEDALHYNANGSNNTANGFQSLYSLTNGNGNVADGMNAFYWLTNGNNNIALGFAAGSNLVVGSYNIDIGNQGVPGDNGTIRIGTAGLHTSLYLAGVIHGDGDGLTNLNAASLPTNVALLTANQTFGGMNAFATNVAIGAASTPERLEVDGTDTAFSPGVSVRIRNTADPIGGFLGNGWESFQLGMYNPSASAVGVIGAGAKRSLFGFDQSGKVGSLAADYGNPSYRNLLDDGSGNLAVAGVINGNGAGLTNVPAAAVVGGLTANIAVLVPGGATNTLCFTNGILMKIQ